ncbi:MAG: hypothetical protein LBV38_05725 [Alistipes sp.]|nr:hypothetical protein [Alistipes sp.]
MSAKFDRDSIVIGDQFSLEVTVEKDVMQVVDFPSFDAAAENPEGAENPENASGAGNPERAQNPDTQPTGPVEIAPGVEILREFPADTLPTDSRRQRIVKRWLLTVWEAGDYSLGRFPALYVDKNVVDTLLSVDSLRIRVSTFDIDLEKDRPYDIKPPLKLPLKFGEISGWIALALLALALLGALIWLLVRHLRRGGKLFGGGGPPVPPHVEAIRRLEALRNQKLPLSGRHKQYYSGITDILRAYIDARFGIGAMEMTSDEILAATSETGEIDSKRYDDLAALLRLADLVKFAKLTPDEGENDRAYFNAYYFVEETKAVVEGKAETIEN